MTPESPRPDLKGPKSESEATNVIPAEPPSAATEEAIRPDAPSGPAAETLAFRKHLPLALDDNYGFPRKASRVGCALGVGVGFVFGFAPVAFSLAKGDVSQSQFWSGCGAALLAGPIAAFFLGPLFWSSGIILQAIYLSFRNARDPEVQRMLRKIEEADEDETEGGDDPFPPAIDTGVQKEESQQ